MPRDDIEITVVVRKANMEQLTSRVPCDAFRLVEQTDGRFAIAVEHHNQPSPLNPAALVCGSLDDLPRERPR